MTEITYAKYAGTHRRRALDKIGTAYPAGWCLKFQLVEIFGVPGIGDFDGDGSADAEDYAKAADKAGTLNRVKSSADIPAGALVLWTGGRNDHGHAAYSLGGGEIVSTDLPKSGKIGRVPATDPATKWGLKLAGYLTVAPTGQHLNKDTPAKPAKAKGKPYTVTARAGLRGRATPSTRARVVDVRPFGSSVQVLRTTTAGGLSWGESASGAFYAMRYLRPA